MSDTSTHHRPSFTQSLVAGACAGIAVDLLFFPLDTLKTRLQSAQGFVRAGGFKGVYKGIGSVVVGSAPGAAAFFTTYDTLKHNLGGPLEHPSPLNHVVSASAGEVAACLIRVPVEVIKSRTQTSTYGVTSNSLDAFKKVMQSDGLFGLYRGFGIMILREIPFTSIQFPLYELLKSKLSHALDGRPLQAYEAAFCGSIAGGIAAATTTPLDVLKTRVMLDMRDSSKTPISLTTRFIEICKNEGPATLFSGIVPRTLWISLGGAVFLGAYESAISLQS
ncbi:S-adenosylmethionine transporter [Tulasnella sp. 419]|nr:S-adenosylmethionine transporter [Tulasnella sp. 418]KAG8968692.1 S-adenosylmethionine transporter [Tulasnella sp. 419]